MANPEDRFWAAVDKEDPTQCWNWVGSIHHSGYGAIYAYRRHMRAHRMSWILHNGEIPAGILVLHKCNNRRCVNPDHLYLGTYLDNALDRVEAGNYGLMWYNERRQRR